MAKQQGATGTSEVRDAIQEGILAEMSEQEQPASETPSEVDVEAQESQSQTEQPPKKEDKAEKPKEDVSEEERIARLVQSRADKLLLQERVKWEKAQQEARQEAEQRQVLSSMDDEQYGQWMRQQEQMRGLLDKASLARTSAVLMGVQDEALKMVPDEASRKAIAERAESGDIKSFGQLMQEVSEALVQHKVKSMTDKITKEVRESVLKELGATETEGGPELGTGASTPVHVDWRKRSATDLIAEGLEEEEKRSRKR